MKRLCRAYIIVICLTLSFAVKAESSSPIVLARWNGLGVGNFTSLEVYLSDDNGVGWEMRGIVDTMYSGDMGLGIGASPSGNLYLVAMGGEYNGSSFLGATCYFSSDMCKTWQKRGSITSAGVYDKSSVGIAVLADSLIYAHVLGTMSSGIEVFKSTDGGFNWENISSIPTSTVEPDPEGEMTFDRYGWLYIAEWASSSYKPTIYRSTNNGEDWDSVGCISPATSSYNSRSIAITSDTTGQALYSSVWSNSCSLKAYRSTDQGVNWDFLSVVLPTNSSGDGVQAITATSGSTLYIATWDYTYNTLVFRSDNGGVIWSQVGEIDGLAYYKATALVMTEVNAAIFGLRVEPDRKSYTDFGKTVVYLLWVDIEGNISDSVGLTLSDIPSEWRAELYDSTGSYLLVDSNGDGKLDLGIVPYDDSTRFVLKVTAPEKSVDISVFNLETIVTGYSLSHPELSDTAIVTTKLLLTKLDVHNYLSPIVDRTTFIFSLPESGKVTITIYNRAGEKVKELIKGNHYSTGIHTMLWDAQNDSGKRVSPGVYIYVFELKKDTGGLNRIVKKTAVLR